MKAKVLTSFSGVMTGAAGDILEITDQVLYDDLLQAQYIEPADEAPADTPKKRKKRA